MTVNDIKMRITKAIDYETLVHFSHTDLDGYGCHLVTRKCALHGSDSMPMTYNSDDLGDKFQEFFTKVVKLITSNSGHMTFLITDIGELNLVELADTFADHNIDVIIIDHHVISNHDKVGTTFNTDEETGLDIYTVPVPSTNMFVYIHSTAHSATWNYAQILGLTKHDEFHWISEYDCGRWGEWRLDAEHTPSNMVRMNQALQIIKSAYTGEKDSVILHHLAEYAAYLADRRCSTDAESYGKLLDFTINAKCAENTRLYNKWLKSIDSVAISHYAYTFRVGIDASYDKKVEVKFPEDPTYLGTWVVIVQEDKDEGPFSMYSKQYLEDNPDVKGIIKYTPNFKDIVSFRSASDEVDVSKIAVLNGGGGHPRAAGFMAKPEILM